MTVELWSRNEFDYTYEREALEYLMADMEFRFGNTDELYLLLANYDLENRQIDLTILKNNAILIIELKQCDTPFTTSENGDWLTLDGHLIGKSGENPYQQVRQCRIKWFNFLKRHKDKFSCLDTAQDDRPFWHTTGIAAICPSLPKETERNISSESWWFELCGLDEIGKVIENQTNQYMNFSNEEIRNIAEKLLLLKPKSHITRRNILKWEEQLKKRDIELKKQEEMIKIREEEVKMKTIQLQQEKENLGYKETALNNWNNLLMQEKKRLETWEEEIKKRENKL